MHINREEVLVAAYQKRVQAAEQKFNEATRNANKRERQANTVIDINLGIFAFFCGIILMWIFH